MAYKSQHELQHYFPKLAEESGFTFNTHRPRVHIDWSKFRHIDIDNLVRERKFFLIEQHLGDIINCALESEFDVRILDEGVTKMFRLAQLSLEYQQFCRHYLDRSVYVLREEITGLVQELDTTKKSVREKDEEIRRLKKKTKHPYRAPLPYGNDNIAAMILKTLTNKGDIFPSTSNGDHLQYNRCSYCDKAFLNQLYLKSHMSRRHPHVVEIPEKDVQDIGTNPSIDKENSKLNAEITNLKERLKEMEAVINQSQQQAPIKSSNNDGAPVQSQQNVTTVAKTETTTDNNNVQKEMKDAEVSTNNESYLLERIEEWKKEEHDKYSKEINLLRTQLLDTINSLKEKEPKEVQKSSQIDPNLIEQLYATIRKQGAEIVGLKQELNNSQIKSQNEESERKKEVEVQMALWAQRTEAQSKQYENLLRKLNDVAKEAKESRAMAESEKDRATQLQTLLERSLNQRPVENVNGPAIVTKPNIKLNDLDNSNKASQPKLQNSAHGTINDKSLKKLHRKAQELLNIRSSSSSDLSSASLEIPEKFSQQTKSNNKTNTKTEHVSKNVKLRLPNRKKTALRESVNMNEMNLAIDDVNELPSEDKPKKNSSQKKSKSLTKASTKQGNSSFLAPESPLKVVRAKITENVNSRLVSAGVDPLKKRLPKSVFQKQRMTLQQNHEFKSKKNPAYQKVRHSILSYLDSTTSEMRSHSTENPDYVSPSKISKPFSFTSVLSNVKSKALSLVKSSEVNMKAKRTALNAEVAIRAMLKSSPDSSRTSPVHQSKIVEAKSRKRDMKSNSSINIINKHPGTITSKEKSTNLIKVDQADIRSNSDDESSESDHKYYNSAITQQSLKSIDNLIKSPARRPASANSVYTDGERKLHKGSGDMVRTQSAVNLTAPEVSFTRKNISPKLNDNSSDDAESLIDSPHDKATSVENIFSVPKQTKSVLKNASSISSLNKKKVLFDMDAIQMKSVSASPSQSITDKSNNETQEKFELGLVNLDGDEWDISSIENEPLKSDTKIQVNTRTSPKIAELKKTIESQLARRADTPSTALVGGVDVLSGPATINRAASVTGSNTSLGSSILDESESSHAPIVNHKAFVKPKRVAEKDDSELDFSEYSIDGIITNNKKVNDF